MLLASACHYALARTPPPDDRAADRTEILASISEISRAYVARDPRPFERLFLDSFVSIRGKPVFNMREQLIAMMQADSIYLRAGKRLDYETLSYEAENPQIRFYGDTAVVTVAKRNLWAYRGQRCLSRIQATELWAKIGGEWKIAASHTNTFHCDSKPYYPIHSAVSAVPQRTRPPANQDFQSEQEVREVIRTIAAAQSSLEEEPSTIVGRFTSDDFVSTGLNGEINNRRDILATIPAAVPARAFGIRNQDDALLIYGNAAVYTYKVRRPDLTVSDGSPQQTSIIFAKAQNQWLIVAAHTSKYSAD